MDRGEKDQVGAARDIARTTPGDRAATFRSQDQVWPHRAIRRAGAVRPLPPHARPLAARISVDDFMTRRRTAGFLVLKNGEVALERYGMGNGPESRWASFALTQPLTSTLVGAALHDGAIGSLDDPCDRYLPQLRECAYGEVTVRNLLRMASGIAWDEGDDSAGADVRRFGRALARGQPGVILDGLRFLPRAAPQGRVFNFSIGESYLLGAVVAAATGRALADYCSQTVWGPAGMEADGLWQLDAEDGLELGGMGLSARLRDLGRFGLLVLEEGTAFSGRQVLPSGWRDLAGQPDCAATAFGAITPGSPAGYGYHWWTLPGAPFADGLHAGAFLALGAYGQRLYINPTEQLVIVMQSAWRQQGDSEAEAETVTLLRAMVRALQPSAT